LAGHLQVHSTCVTALLFMDVEKRPHFVLHSFRCFFFSPFSFVRWVGWPLSSTRSLRKIWLHVRERILWKKKIGFLVLCVLEELVIKQIFQQIGDFSFFLKICWIYSIFWEKKIFCRIRTAILVLVAKWRNFAPKNNSDCIAWSVVDIDGPGDSDMIRKLLAEIRLQISRKIVISQFFF
jgi:hypothetical protein